MNLEEKQWLCRISGQEVGPLSLEQLRRLAAGKSLRPTDEVRRANDTRWMPAGNLADLFQQQPKKENERCCGLCEFPTPVADLGVMHLTIAKITGSYKRQTTTTKTVPIPICVDCGFRFRRRMMWVRGIAIIAALVLFVMLLVNAPKDAGVMVLIFPMMLGMVLYGGLPLLVSPSYGRIVELSQEELCMNFPEHTDSWTDGFHPQSLFYGPGHIQLPAGVAPRNTRHISGEDRDVVKQARRARQWEQYQELVGERGKLSWTIWRRLLLVDNRLLVSIFAGLLVGVLFVWWPMSTMAHGGREQSAAILAGTLAGLLCLAIILIAFSKPMIYEWLCLQLGLPPRTTAIARAEEKYDTPGMRAMADAAAELQRQAAKASENTIPFDQDEQNLTDAAGSNPWPDIKEDRGRKFREWTDHTMQKQVYASLLQLTDGKVKLRKENGSLMQIAADKLSRFDQSYLRSVARVE